MEANNLGNFKFLASKFYSKFQRNKLEPKFLARGKVARVYDCVRETEQKLIKLDYFVKN